jgi:hypothetical protein
MTAHDHQPAHTQQTIADDLQFSAAFHMQILFAISVTD